MRTGFLFLLLLSALISCSKRKLDLNSFYQCNASQHLDSSATVAKLAGSWLRSRWSSSSTGRQTLTPKNIKVAFNPNQTFAVYESGVVTVQGTWKLIRADNIFWGLNLSSPSEYLYGRIFFCEDQLLFNDSYVDGFDNLFDRSN